MGIVNDAPKRGGVISNCESDIAAGAISLFTLTKVDLSQGPIVGMAMVDEASKFTACTQGSVVRELICLPLEEGGDY
ncbi:MAG: hypothetical protein AAF889_03805 [Cyanobacteria bacterium P01_D01_bin.73]